MKGRMVAGVINEEHGSTVKNGEKIGKTIREKARNSPFCLNLELKSSLYIHLEH